MKTAQQPASPSLFSAPKTIMYWEKIKTYKKTYHCENTIAKISHEC